MAPAAARTSTRLRNKPSRRLVDASVGSLLAAGLHELAPTAARFGPLAIALTAVGSLGLGLASVNDLGQAQHPELRIDAAHGAAWALQGLASLVAHGSRSSGAVLFASTAGSLGGAIQAGIGLHRLFAKPKLRPRTKAGQRRALRQRRALGLLDVTAGVCWAAAAWSIAAPYSLAGFVGLSAVRLAYTNQRPLARLARGLGKRIVRGQAAVKDAFHTSAERLFGALR